MIRSIVFFLAFIFSILFQIAACGAEPFIHADIQFPYSLTGRENKIVFAGSTQILFLNIESANLKREETAEIKIILPEGFRALESDGWNMTDPKILTSTWKLASDYGQAFSAVSLLADKEMAEGDYAISVEIHCEDKDYGQKVEFRIESGADIVTESAEKEAHATWYMQSAVVPVDENGKIDRREEKDILHVRDVTLENMRNLLTGGKAADWPSLLSTPAAYMLLELRNPNRDTQTIHFIAELVDRSDGKVKPGLISAGAEDGNLGWNGGRTGSTEASIGLLPQINQSVVIPLYVNPFTVSPGNYNLRITLEDGHVSKITEVPLTVVKKRSVGVLALIFAGFCLVWVIVSFKKLSCCIIRIGARGDITVALFAALAFGGVSVPVTLLGDFFHVILGPFSGLITGFLSGIVQYVLLVALLILFRQPGVLSLYFLIRWLLSAILFGRVTLVGILICAVSIVVLESVLWVGGFFRKEIITERYAIFIAISIGLGDALITFISMEQMMFFYRLYYADWFITLYMIINGVIYSSIGAWMGYRIGGKLKQVMGA